jgi:hypothetical protein
VGRGTSDARALGRGAGFGITGGCARSILGGAGAGGGRISGAGWGLELGDGGCSARAREGRTPLVYNRLVLDVLRPHGETARWSAHCHRASSKASSTGGGKTRKMQGRGASSPQVGDPKTNDLLKRIQRILPKPYRRREVADEQPDGRAAEGVLEDARELGVAVGDAGLRRESVG